MGKKEIFYKTKDVTEIRIPSNSEYVVSANIRLLDANGKEIDRWDGVSISSFPYKISASNITTSSVSCRLTLNRNNLFVYRQET